MPVAGHFDRLRNRWLKVPQVVGPTSTDWLLRLWCSEFVEVEGLRAGYESRGDIGVRFDRLNELRDGQSPEPVEGSKGSWPGEHGNKLGEVLGSSCQQFPF